MHTSFWHPLCVHYILLLTLKWTVLEVLLLLQLDEIMSSEGRSNIRLHYVEFHDLYSSPNIMQAIVSRKMTWVRHVVHWGGGDAFRAFVGKSEKRPLWRPGNDGRKILKWMGQHWLYSSGSGQWQVVGLWECSSVVQQISTQRTRYFGSTFICESFDEVDPQGERVCSPVR